MSNIQIALRALLEAAEFMALIALPCWGAWARNKRRRR
jgi:hypothetical protein